MGFAEQNIRNGLNTTHVKAIGNDTLRDHKLTLQPVHVRNQDLYVGKQKVEKKRHSQSKLGRDSVCGIALLLAEMVGPVIVVRQRLMR